MQQTTFSFEFFPPKTDQGMQNMAVARDALAKYSAEFFSVTFGAGGSTRDRTMDAVLAIKDAGYNAAPHISCISSTKDEIKDLLDAYKAKGINRLVTLRGDMPSGLVSGGDFKYANELVSFIREQTGDHFHLEVAAYPEFHPEAKSPKDDLMHLKNKIDAGADSVITQYFYNTDAFFRFKEQCDKLGITVPIIPGVMPIYNFTQLSRFSNVCGADIPRWLAKRLEEYGDDADSLQAFGIDVVSQLCETMKNNGVTNMHFYTLNRASVVAQIIENIS